MMPCHGIDSDSNSDLGVANSGRGPDLSPPVPFSSFFLFLARLCPVPHVSWFLMQGRE